MIVLAFIFLNSWSADVFVSEGYTSYPTQHNIVCDVNGRVHATWFKWHRYGLRYSGWYGYYTGRQWVNMQEISAPLGNVFAGYPSIAVSEDKIYCLWKSNWGRNSNIVLRRFSGGNWEDTVIIISSGAKYSFTPSAVCDFTGVLHIVWEKDYEIHYRKLDGSVLSIDTMISNSGVYASYPAIATFNNKVYVVWQDLRDGNFEIYFKEFNGTHWEEAIRVTNSSTASIFPNICVDLSGIVHIVWQEDGMAGYKIYYTNNEQGNFALCSLIVDSPGEAITPSILAVGGEIHLVWSDSRDGDWEIYYKTKNQKSKSKDEWGDEVRLTHSAGISANPNLCGDVNGNLYLLFWDNRDQFPKVYFKKKTSSKYVTTLKLTVSPNPFTQKTVIRIQGIEGSRIQTGGGHSEQSEEALRLEIYELTGRLINSFTLTPNHLSLTTDVVWDGRDSKGLKVNSGVYFVRVVGTQSITYPDKSEFPLRSNSSKVVLIR